MKRIVRGREVAGVIDEIGEGVVGWTVGTRVGVGWFGGHCGRWQATPASATLREVPVV